MSISALEVHEIKIAPPVEGVLPVLLERWSSRSFQNRPVGRADLVRIFEAARWTASANNEQPWRFLLGEAGSATHQALASNLMGFNKAWAAQAPMLILGVVSQRFSHNGNPNPYAMFDLGGAANYLTLQAAALGLTTHQMAGFDHEAVRRELAIPEEFALGTIIALGYQGDPMALENEQLREREMQPRSRRGLQELVFSSWGVPARLD